MLNSWSRRFLVACVIASLTACVGLGRGDVAAVVMQQSPALGQLLNSYRADNGLSQVTRDQRLMQAAADHARDLAGRDTVSHSGSDGSDPAKRVRATGYNFYNIGENVSAGRASRAEVIQAWIDSPPHKANLDLSPATHFGMAHAFAPDSKYKHFWVLVIGTPADQAPTTLPIGRSAQRQ
jgi:uncharacterized protein YkwD